MPKPRKPTPKQQQALTKQLQEFFEANGDGFMKGKDVRPERRLNARPDLNAFLLIDKLVPGSRDIIGAADHDELFFDVMPWELMLAAEIEDLLDLIRCGVRFDGKHESLCMFV